MITPIGTVQTPATGVKVLVKRSKPVLGQVVNVEILGAWIKIGIIKVQRSPLKGCGQFLYRPMQVKVKGQGHHFRLGQVVKARFFRK